MYLISVLIGSLTGLVAAAMSTSGIPAQVGFVLLSIAWFYSGWMAYKAARSKRFAEHRVWMIRNYSLTFAAVLLRVFIVTGQGLQSLSPDLAFGDIYTSAVWSSILVSYLVAERFPVKPAKVR